MFNKFFWGGEKFWFVVFIDFCGVYIFINVDFEYLCEVIECGDGE